MSQISRVEQTPNNKLRIQSPVVKKIAASSYYQEEDKYYFMSSSLLYWRSTAKMFL
jgi:hypothetical protein